MAGCLLFLATRERLLLRAFCMELTGGSSHIGHPTNRVSELCHENRLHMAWGMGLWLVMVESFSLVGHGSLTFQATTICIISL